MSFRHRMRRVHAALGGAAALPDIETHALVFDGVADYGYAANGAQGVGGTWSYVLKVNGRHTGSPKYFGHVHDGTATAGGQIIDGVYAGTNTVFLNGATTGGTFNGNYLFSDVGGTDRTGVQCIVVVHRNVPTRRVDYYITRGGATLAKGGVDLTAGGQARTPLHIAVGAALSGSQVPVATTYSPTHLIAALIIDGVVSEAEAQAYSLAANAKAVWPTPFGYWPPALISGASVPNQGVGTANAMTLSGPTAADLEAL